MTTQEKEIKNLKKQIETLEEGKLTSDKLIENLNNKLVAYKELNSRLDNKINDLEAEIQSLLPPLETEALTRHIETLLQTKSHVQQQQILKQLNHKFIEWINRNIKALNDNMDILKGRLGAFEKTKELSNLEYNKILNDEIYIVK